jgi:hypothetical protein
LKDILKHLYLKIKTIIHAPAQSSERNRCCYLIRSFPAIVSEFISSCKTKDKTVRAGFFSDDEFNVIEGIADNLLPETSTPGALQAQVPYFIELVVKNCMSIDDQQMIKKGLEQMNKESKFLTLSAPEKVDAVKSMDEAAFTENSDQAWFRIIKKLALIGYFTSQEGMTKALNYVKVPGDYQPCISYKKGEKALAKTFLMYW